MRYRYQPLILIGAARSGTKLVRDLIAAHPAVDRVPYDINYIWRLGNEHLPHDELSPELLTPQIRQRILRGFTRYSSWAPFLIEKTVSNCLRVAYVHAVFPEARFIHLVRDGRDVIESVYRQWIAPPDWRYILEKAKSFPLTEAFGYALYYARYTCRKLVTPDKKKSGTWGPRYAGIDEDLASKDLLEVCAIQWARSVERALSDLSSLPIEQVLSIRYEDFVRNPCSYLEMIAQFAGIAPVPYLEKVNVEIVSQQNIGKGSRNLSPEQMALVLPRIHNALSLLNYNTTLPQRSTQQGSDA